MPAATPRRGRASSCSSKLLETADPAAPRQPRADIAPTKPRRVKGVSDTNLLYRQSRHEDEALDGDAGALIGPGARAAEGHLQLRADNCRRDREVERLRHGDDGVVLE